MKRDPDHPAVHWLRAVGLAWLQEWDRALEAYARTAETEAARCQWDGRPTDTEPGVAKWVIDNLTVWAGRDPNNVEVRAALALACLAMNRNDEADRAAQQVLEKAPNHPRALAARGTVFLHRKEFVKARADFSAALAGRPGYYLAALGLARVLEQMAAWPEALAAYDALLVESAPGKAMTVNDGQRAEAHLGRARALAQLARVEDSHRAVDDARPFDPKAADALAARLFPPAP